MPKLIQDEFTMAEVSSQRKYQLRHNRDGLCRLCNRQGVPYCPEHANRQRSLTRSLRASRRNPQDLI